MNSVQVSDHRDDPQSDLLQRIEEQLFTAVVHDVLDDLGYRQQALPPALRPLPTTTKLVGRAATFLCEQARRTDETDPYDLLLEFVDGLRDGEVAVGTTSSSTPGALWGELMSAAALRKGARGVVMDGDGRDISQLMRMRFPAFFTGYSPAGTAGRMKVAEIRRNIYLGGVRVSDGDLVIGDLDGCLVVPREIESQVLTLAFEKVSGEKRSRTALEDGMGLVEMYEKFGIL